ncbi:MAG: penicillin-binding protein A [Oscillospiraceae bacterium]|nr:penicillin-binding protein A [Oscillospiraceae bacterium]
MGKLKLYFRIVPVILILFLFLLGATARLYNLQITNGDANLRQTEKRVVRTVTLSAARGELLDRYGRPLVVNRLSYALRIDRDRLLSAEDPNGALDRLTRLMKAQGVAYEDGFPVIGPYYHYRFDLAAQDETRLARFLEKVGWPELSAAAFMEKLIERFGIDPEWDVETKLRVAGVRYELELRYLFNKEAPYYFIAPYQFAADVDMALIGIVREQDFPGVLVDTVPIREYRTAVAAHLLGRVGAIPEEQAGDYEALGYAADETVGLDGMEYGLEKWLRGQDGQRVEETTKGGKVTNIVSSVAPAPGQNCLLTIDIRLQERVERALSSGVQALYDRGVGERLPEEHLAGGGATVLMSVKTGEILAMASYPTFDLARFQEDFALLVADPMSPMLNRAIAGVYEPGSTYKMTTALAALESGTITPQSTVYDTGTYMYYAPSYTPRCTGVHGSVNLARAIQVSCNYFFYDVGRRTGIEAIDEYARKLGFGAITGIELPGERPGILAGPEARKERGEVWNGGDVLQAAIGQSDNLFTPLQMCGYVATLANGGVRLRPHLLSTVKSYDYSQTIYDEQVEVVGTMDLKADTLDTILSGMRRVAQPGGTAASVFASYPIPVGAKTGSAQKAADGRPANGVFVAFAPFDDPEVAVAVVVERGGAGARVAPIAKEIFDAYFEGAANMSGLPGENQLQG